MELGKKDTVLESETANKQRPADGCRAPRLLLSRSTQTTRNNRTGDWRFVRPIFEDKTAPCSVACPVGEDIPRIEMLAARGQFRQAWEAVMQENPFPATCGRVCFHPCEGACNRSEFDAPLAIHHVERYLGEHALKENLMPPVRPAKANGKRVAIVGAGPSGLSAAFFLTNLGYQCHVYEAREEAGGLLRWGIPEYRLPLRILAGETSRLERLGVHIHRQTPVARDILDGAGGDVHAVFVGCGHARSVFPGIEGQSLMLDGLEYLRAVRSGAAPDISGDVVVIGGGNTAIDVARSLVRGDARPVILYRRRLADMPVFEQEREAALAEGVRIRELVAPVSVEADRGRLRLSVQAMRPSGERAGDGRSRVVPTGGETRVLTVDKVFAATGAEADAAWAPGRETEYMRLELSHCLLELRAFPVLYGGDLASPVQSVTHALMSGKQASMALDTYFQAGIAAVAPRLAECRVGEGPAVSMEKYHSSDARRASPQVVVYADINSSLFDRSERGAPPRLSPECRVRTFSAVEACLAGQDAVQEANRCFSCGTCNGCGYCRLFCPEMAVALGARRTIDLDYCKGCGICVAECPRNAMRLEAEAP